jgi:hypothetical protein
MLLKVKNVHDNWEIWDRISHVTIQPLSVSFRDSKEEDAPPGVHLEVGITRPDHQHSVDMVQLSTFPDEVLFDIDFPTKTRWGKFITAEMVDGKTKTFAFVTEGYLMSDDGHTLESFNKR